MKKRISVYIDGANFFYGLKSINKKYSDFCFDFNKYIGKIVGRDNLISVYYYNAPLIQSYNKELYWKQVKFFNRLKKINKFKVILCKRQRRIDDKNKEYYVIKGDDIHLSLDMLKDACKDKCDKSILISSDGDFTYLVDYVRKEGKFVEIHSFKELTSASLVNASSKHIWITKKIINKNFLRNLK